MAMEREMSEKRYRIVYEDDRIMVIDKPSGMLVIPTPKKETNTLTSLINRDLDKRGVGANAYPCHRLDRETSGLIIYSKGKKAQKAMMDEFKDRSVKKKYIAFVQGRVRKDYDIIRERIYNRKKKRSEAAETRYRVLSRRRDFTEIEVEPVTGRTNQIRMHMEGIGHPIVGERVYSFRKDFKLRFRRVALHARHIEFIHPVNKARMLFDSPLPDDMSAFLSEHAV